MSKHKFEAILFDIDGTILDTREYIYQAYKHTIFRYLGRKITWQQVAPTLGLHLRDCYRILTGLEQVEDLMETHDQFQNQNLQLIVAYQNSRPVLKALEKAGLMLGAVTNRYGEQVEKSLKLTGVDKYFKVVITPQEVKKPKPDAEAIHAALGKLKVSTNKTVVIGDSPFDIQAGKSAGCKTIGAGYGYHGSKLSREKPDYMISDIGEILPIILG